MNYAKVERLIAERLYSAKKIRASFNEVRKLVNRLFQYFILFNSLEEDATWILDRNVAEIEIPSEFKDFLLPNSVRFGHDRLYPDLLARQGKAYFHEEKLDKASDEASDDFEPDTSGLSYSDYVNTCYQLYSLLKRQPSFTKLSEIRQNVLLTDLVPRIEVKGRLSYNGTPCIPVNVTVSLAPLIGNYIPNTRTTDVIEEYILRMFRE